MPLWTPSTLSAQPTFPSAPPLNSYQMQVNGPSGSLTIGAGTAYVITEIQGLGDTPTLRTVDTGRPRGTGEFLGFDYSGGRDVTVKLWVSSAYGGGTPIQTLLATLAAVMVPSALVEFPLWFKLPNLSTMALVCRPREKTAPMDLNYANSGVAIVTLKFHATDPRCYTADSPTTMNLSSSSGALVYPFTDPLTYTGTTVTGSITNNGNASADCLIEFAGASIDAFVANTTSDQALALWSPAGTAGDLNGGDVLWIDTQAHTVIYWPSGATTGQSQRGWLEPGSSWFAIANGAANGLKIGSNSASSATCVVHAPSAYML